MATKRQSNATNEGEGNGQGHQQRGPWRSAPQSVTYTRKANNYGATALRRREADIHGHLLPAYCATGGSRQNGARTGGRWRDQGLARQPGLARAVRGPRFAAGRDRAAVGRRRAVDPHPGTGGGTAQGAALPAAAARAGPGATR